ncbi:MAG TPA: SusC/RagA family TonB-linked outer membrane protein [Chitinophagaceae bacterium]|nr:SusC/RagA family TonB-linked outer membrane protein [Chitinophagaceae bacterium]
MRQKLLLSITLMCFCFLQSFAQQRTITGSVLTKEGTPLSDASVTVVGDKTGVRTGSDGTFSINVPATAKQLQISYVGSESQKVTIISINKVTVVMETAAQALENVVVIGYGSVRKKDLTGAVASVQAKDFNKGTYTAPDQLIQGKAAGVLVINNTGQPGGATTVRIRGTSSIRSGNQPLFVVDDVPLSGGSARPGGNGDNGGNPLTFMNPNDIAGIEILKDASATAIYGSRGANGVVLITTKRGKTGVPVVDVSGSVGISNVLKKLEVLSANEYRKTLADYNVGTDSTTGRLKGDFGNSVDAFDAITRTALTQSYNAAVGGGTENGRYRISAGYLDQQGIIENSGLKKVTANLTSNFKFLESKKLSLNFNVLVTQTNEEIVFGTAGVGFTGNLIAQALQWNPTHLLKKPGTDSAWIDPAVGSTTVNPLAELNYFNDRATVNTVIASVSPAYKITNDLEYKLVYSVNRQVGNRKIQTNRLLNDQGSLDRGFAAVRNEEQTNTQITNTLNFNKQITSDFNLNAVIGHEWLTYDKRGTFEGAQDFTNVGLNYYDYLQFSTQNSRGVGSFADPTTELQSFFGRAIINYKDKYLITGTIRADGSTRFGKNNKYGYFPSVGVAWNVTQEDFLVNNSLINNLKVRLSWGKTGNQEFPSGASLDRFGFGQQSISQSNYGNADLKWETSTTTNAGIDFSILNNRLSGAIDYFYKKTTDVLFEQNIVQPAPGGKIWINLPGNVVNKGVELMLTAGLIRKSDMNWNIGGNASFLQNSVNGLVGFYETGELRGQGFSDVRGQRVISGQPLNVWYLRRFEGLDKATGQSIYSDGGNTLYYSGSPNPKMLLGLSSDFSYKKFSAAVNMNGTFGHYVFNNTAASVLGIGNLGTRNIAKSILGGSVQEAISNAPAPSTRNLEKGNYIKMANASIGYRIGNLGKDIKNVYISVTGQNLFVITKYTGFDPEVNTDAGFGGIPSLGVEYVPYPSARTFQIGVNFSL